MFVGSANPSKTRLLLHSVMKFDLQNSEVFDTRVNPKPISPRLLLGIHKWNIFLTRYVRGNRMVCNTVVKVKPVGAVALKIAAVMDSTIKVIIGYGYSSIIR